MQNSWIAFALAAGTRIQEDKCDEDLSVAILALAVVAWAEEAKTDSSKGPEKTVLRRLPPLDQSKLERASKETLNGEEVSDEKNGVFVTVAERKQEKPPLVISNEREEIIVSGIKWLVNVHTMPDKVTTTRIRLTPGTIKYLITTPNAPLGPRFIALGVIFYVDGLSQRERLDLIELASRDAMSTIRYMAVLKAREYKPVDEAIPILCRALCDPCAGVARETCGILNLYFHLVDDRATGSGVSSGYSGYWTQEQHYRHVRDLTLDVARKVHDLRPDLVADEDLATITRLRESYVAEPLTPAESKLIGIPKSRQKAKPEAKAQERPDAKSPKAESK